MLKTTIVTIHSCILVKLSMMGGGSLVCIVSQYHWEIHIVVIGNEPFFTHLLQPVGNNNCLNHICFGSFKMREIFILKICIGRSGFVDIVLVYFH